jgi:ABC-type glycerol-3-phosphate transport system permease component
MPAILKSELRSMSTRLLVVAMYAILVAGGLTMVYPFLLMASGSLKSNVDVQDYDIVPLFWHDDAMLYRKYIEEKCNERFNDFAENYVSSAFSFADVMPPPAANSVLLKDWSDFTGEPVPRGFYRLGASISRDGANVPPNLRAFRRHIQSQCGGDVRALQERYGINTPNWMVVAPPYEPLTDRGHKPSEEPLHVEFYRFKESRPAHERIYLNLDHAFAAFVSVLPKYGRDVAVFNRMNHTRLASFEELSLPERCPDEPHAASDWEAYVRSSMNPRFIALDPGARTGFATFLERRYVRMERLNALYLEPGQPPYTRFGEVPFPTDTHARPARFTDMADFIQDTGLLPARDIRIDTPSARWRHFLKDRYADASLAAKAHGRAYKSFAVIPMPQAEVDFAYCRMHAGQLRRHFSGRNFKMVFEYILLYGRGIRNTILYCALAVLAALTVNPMAAYALSRYKLRGQYKIILFLIATMAFPPVVTMIPNFLLIRELGLLNTFAALILPGMANGYSIFLLKGFFDSLPREMYEAADIDGASEWQKFWIIAMSLSKPILAVIALGAFLGAYSNFMMAFILCQDQRMWTLMVWLFKLQSFASQGVVFASLMVAAVPTLIMFVLCQNLIIRGIVVPTEK